MLESIIKIRGFTSEISKMFRRSDICDGLSERLRRLVP